MPTPAPEEPLDVTAVLRDLAWTVHRRVPEAAGLDPLPTTELAVLKHVLDAPGLTVSTISRHLGLQQSNTSAALRTLAERGLVHREASPADRRATLVHPTAAALADHATISAAWSGEMRTVLDRLDPADATLIEAAAAALARLDAGLREERPAPAAGASHR